MSVYDLRIQHTVYKTQPRLLSSKMNKQNEMLLVKIAWKN